MTTPNMGLEPPIVGTTPGPDWASDLNDCFDIVDVHDHSPGNGVRVPSAGININADIPFGGYNAYNFRTVRFSTTAVTPGVSDVACLYQSGGELIYRDALGQAVTMTNNGSVAGATGSISGLTAPATASFNSGTGYFSFLKDTSKPGKLSISDISISEFNNATANVVTVKSAASLAASYSLTLPASLTASDAPLSISSTGVVTPGLADGAVGTPSMTFAADLDTGFYRIGSGSIGVASNGAQIGIWSNLGVQIPSGSAGLPGFSFIGDTDTGIYRSAANTMDFQMGGTTLMRLDTTEMTMSEPIAAIAGVAALPGIRFKDDTGLGFIRSSAGVIDVIAASATAFRISSTSVRTINPCLAPDGSAAAPAYSFFSDPDTGWYSSSANEISFAGAGAQRMSLSTTQLLMGSSAGATTPTFGFLGDADTGMYRVGANEVGFGSGGSYAASISGSGIQIGGTSNGFFKVKFLTGSLSSGFSTSIVVGGTVLGATGKYVLSGSTYILAGTPNATSAYFLPTTSGEIKIQNSEGGSISYSIMVFYS